jgi:hypothetical protein
MIDDGIREILRVGQEEQQHLMSNLSLVTSSNDSVAGYTEWENYSKTLQETIFPGILQQFEVMYTELKAAVKLSASIQRLKMSGANLDPDIVAFASGDFKFVSPAERKGMAKYTRTRRKEIQTFVEEQFANISKTIRGTEKIILLDNLESNATSQLNTIRRNIGDMIADENDGLSDDLVALKMDYIEGPATNFSSKLRDQQGNLTRNG